MKRDITPTRQERRLRARLLETFRGAEQASHTLIERINALSAEKDRFEGGKSTQTGAVELF
jgi:hypothetical protein